MVLPPKVDNLKGDRKAVQKSSAFCADVVDTYDGKIHIEWDPDAAVTPMGLLPFFIQFLKMGGRFNAWVNDCPLRFCSNNAPQKLDVLGSLFLSILSGHKRYAHITTLMCDGVNPALLGMNKIVSEDSARRAIKKIEQQAGIDWLQTHLHSCCAPLLKTPWILDVDTTVKPLYGHQENAVKGYNPQKPDRPSHTYHTYMMANLRLVLDVEVNPGDHSHSTHSLPGLIGLLNQLPADSKPELVRGDIGFGTDTVMRELEAINQGYLFKLKKSRNVNALIYQHHGVGKWTRVHGDWEAKSDELQLQGWEHKRRVVIVRRKIANDNPIAIEFTRAGETQLALLDGPENTRAYEYSVLVTSANHLDLPTLFYHYRDRADCENNFDELKNQWGWGGYTSQDVKSCRLMSRMIALIYNWWNLYVRLAHPDQHHEAITSRPLLLSGIGRQTKHSNQKTLTITSMHGNTGKLARAYHRLAGIFNALKTIAPQLTPGECWSRLLQHIIDYFEHKKASMTAENALPSTA